MEKVGKHYYMNDQKISWEDTFISEQDDIRERILNLEFDAEWLWNKSIFAIKTLFYMSKGFFDHGRSFDQGIEILEDEFMLSQIISPETMSFFWDERDALMVNWNFEDAWVIARKHVNERWHHFQKEFRMGDFLYHYV